MYAGFSCWWVDYKLWVLLVVWGDQMWVLVVNDSRPSGLEAKNLEALLKIALEGPNENFDNIIGEAIPLWENGSKLWFLYANPSRYMSFASDAS